MKEIQRIWAGFRPWAQTVPAGWATGFPPRVRRRLTGLAVILALLGLGRFMSAMVAGHGGMIYGDSFTYITYARSLAHGQLYYMEGPVADMIAAAEWPEGRRHWEPIWNYTVRPDGHTVCSMAIGYPLLLAGAMKTGGIWLAHHLNLMLVAGFLLVLALLVWEGLGRSAWAGWVALAVALLMPRVQPQAIQQFTYPWREPYFFILVLGAAWLLLRFQRSGRGAWLAGLALLAGMACAVKEINVIYVVWLGVMILTLPAYRRHPRVVGLSLACVALFWVGLAPLLAQNALANGNPFVSCQMLRETRHFSLAAPGAGLSLGNAPSTLYVYLRLYARNPYYTWWVIALTLGGAVLSQRHLLGRTLLGFAVVHFIIYTQWGHADTRQSYFFNVPYTFFLVYGSVGLLRTAARYLPARLRPVGQAAPLIVLAWALLAPYPALWQRRPALRYADAQRLVAEIDAQMPPEALVLVNRSVRDIMGAYSERHFIRLSELRNLRRDHDAQPLIEPLAQAGHLYFLDNVDRDPHAQFRANRTRIDQETLLERYQFERVAEWDRDAYNMGNMVDQQQLTLYRVLPWNLPAGGRPLTVPPEGASFLFVNRRGAATNLVVTLDGQEVPLPEGGGYYCPVADWSLTGTVLATWHNRDGSPVPPLPDLALIGWRETLHIDFGLDAVPRDQPYFPQPLSGRPVHAPSRSMPASFSLRLPVFARPDVFWGGRIFANSHRDAVQITGPDGITRETVSQEQRIRFVLPETAIGAEMGPVADHFRIDFHLPERPGLNIAAAQVFPCYRYLIFDPQPASRGFYWRALLLPDQTGTNAHPWTLRQDGVVRRRGRALCSQRNEIAGFGVFSRTGEPVQLDFQGAGVLEVTQGQVGEQLAIRMGEMTRYLIAPETDHGTEHDEDRAHFCWSRAEMRVHVPLTPGAKAYRLQLDARDGHPTATRELEIALGNYSTRIPLLPARRLYDVQLPAPAEEWGLATLALRITTWQPSAVLGNADQRELGFRFYGLDWRPLE